MAHGRTFLLLTAVLVVAVHAEDVASSLSDEVSRTGNDVAGEFENHVTQDDVAREFEKRTAQENHVTKTESSRTGRGLAGEFENHVTQGETGVVARGSSRRGRGVVGDFAKGVALECLLSGDWRCVQTKAWGAVSQWFTKGAILENKKQQLENEDQEDSGSENEVGGRSMVQQVAEALYEGVSAIFVARTEEERQAMVQRGARAIDSAVYDLEEQGRKKDKKGALQLAIKLIMLKSAIFTKISTLIQMKTFVVAKLLLLIEAAKLLMSLKNKGGGGGGGGEAMQEEPEHHIGPDRSDDRVYVAHRPMGSFSARKQQPLQYEQIYY